MGHMKSCMQRERMAPVEVVGGLCEGISLLAELSLVQSRESRRNMTE